MCIAGLVVTVDERRIADVVETLACDKRLTIGEPNPPRVPLTIETGNGDEMRLAIEHVRCVEGVLDVAIAFATVDHEQGS